MTQAIKSHLVIALLAGAILVMGCGTSETIPTSPRYDTATDLNALQNYVAIGNSLTAGYQSGAWGNPNHVATSFPALIARQLGITNFKQVSLSGTGLGFSGGSPVGNMVVNFNAQGRPVLTYTTADPANLIALSTGAAADFDFGAPRNFGIPGISLAHAVGAPLSVYAAGNPYAALYTNATSANKTQLQLADEAGAGFITCWLGNNDVLGFVTSGGVAPTTDDAAFAGSINLALGTLGDTPYLAVMNIPSVTSIPFVTYFNPVLNAMLDQVGSPVHAVWVMDDATGVAVPVFTDPGTNNYVLLPAASAMAADPTLGASSGHPLPDSMVLDATEVAAAQAKVLSFNTLIANAVSSLNVGRAHPVLLVDMNAFFTHIVAHGYHTAGSHFTTRFVSGGIFSLDGVHPTSLGNAIVANEIIAEMNEGWDLDVEPVDLAEFIGVGRSLAADTDPVILPEMDAVVSLFQH